jgi:hypothetical protein
MLGLFHFSDLEKNAVLEERSGWRTPLNVLAAPRSWNYARAFTPRGLHGEHQYEGTYYLT